MDGVRVKYKDEEGLDDEEREGSGTQDLETTYPHNTRNSLDCDLRCGINYSRN